MTKKHIKRERSAIDVRAPNPRRRRKRARGRRGLKRRNPWDDDEALGTGVGAGVGSLVGGIAGAVAGLVVAAPVVASPDVVEQTPERIFALPILSWLGSIAGGAIGGRIGASERNKGRGTTGGAIGGIFGPIGAAVGGAAAGGYSRKSHNPTPLGWAAIAAGAVAAVGSAAWAVKKIRNDVQYSKPIGGDTTEPGGQ